MTRLCKSIVLGLQIILVGISSAVAQDRQITRAGFEAYMKRSREATKDTPFREKITGETGDLPAGPWKPHYDYFRVSVIPDRYRIVYPDGAIAETIQIGQVGYIKKVDGPWVRYEPGGPGVSRPASMPYFKNFNCRVGAENQTTLVTCVTKSKPRIDKDMDLNTNTFWFDGSGILFKRESIVFNSVSWSRHLVLYEYDPSISIEAPQK